MNSSEDRQVEEREEADTYEYRTAALRRELDGIASRKAICVLAAVNLIILFTRPQNDLSILRLTYVPLILSLCSLPLVIPRLGSLWRSSMIVKAMFALLVLGAAWVPLAHNNAYAYFTFRDVATQFVLYLFPLIILVQTGRQFKNLTTVIACIGSYLAIYSMTHAGRGPGAFLGDENDLCLALLGFLGLPLFLFSHARSQSERLLYIGSVGLMLAGIVVSLSRGGFLGLIALLGFLFLRSRAKLIMIGFGCLTLIAGFFFVPQDYWDEMSTIKDVQGGTADERTRTWMIAFDIWAHPPHIAFGTGMNNARAWMGEFEPQINKSNYHRSLAGRSIHSTLFQLLADLGIAGVLIIGTALWLSYRGNSRNDKQMIRLIPRIRKVDFRIREYIDQKSIVHKELLRDVPVPSIPSACAEVDWQATRTLLRRSVGHLQYISAFSLGLNACWAGVLVSGLFVSVLYYPSIWFLVVLSLMMQKHAERCRARLAEVLETIEFREVEVEA